jgi:hypothetical protein
MRRDQTVRVKSGWLTGQIGYVERVDGEHALVLIHGHQFPFPRCERMPLAHLEVIDLRAQRDRAARDSVGESPF